MDDKTRAENDGELFPETETRRVAERFAPRPRPVSPEGARAIEEALRQEPPLPPPQRPVLRSLNAILAERRATHGEFDNDALTSQRLKSAMRDTVKWSLLNDVQREALENIATKIGRILSGDPNHADHWNDIQGYARLTEERL